MNEHKSKDNTANNIDQTMNEHKSKDNTANNIDQTRYPMPDWAVRQVIRTSGLVENVCKHGVGHPHPASVKEFEDRGIMSMGVHGCDGCCCNDNTKPKDGDTMIALLQHRVKIIAINSNDTANVLLLPETSLPEGAVLVVNNVPFRYLLDDVPTVCP